MRENLIELLSTADDYEDSVCRSYSCKTCPYKGMDCTYRAKADHLIAHGVTVQKWIPVTERLPERGGSYLVFSSKSKTVFAAHYWLGDRWSNRANGQFITHWMPLPEPPKGE